MIHRIASGLLVGSLALPTFALDISEYQRIDLSHSYNSDTLYWPTSPSKFEKNELAFGETADGYFYSAFSISTPEHGGKRPFDFSTKRATSRLPAMKSAGVPPFDWARWELMIPR